MPSDGSSKPTLPVDRGDELAETPDLLEQADAQADPELRRPAAHGSGGGWRRAKVELHELANGIRPPDLESGGLVAALPHLVGRAAPDGGPPQRDPGNGCRPRSRGPSTLSAPKASRTSPNTPTRPGRRSR